MSLVHIASISRIGSAIVVVANLHSQTDTIYPLLIVRGIRLFTRTAWIYVLCALYQTSRMAEFFFLLR